MGEKERFGKTPFCCETYWDGVPDNWGGDIMENEWVSCSDHWPEIGIEVLVWDGNAYYIDYVIEIDSSKKTTLGWAKDGMWTYWRRLPESP